jgi:hypothetical protein
MSSKAEGVAGDATDVPTGATGADSPSDHPRDVDIDALGREIVDLVVAALPRYLGGRVVQLRLAAPGFATDQRSVRQLTASIAAGVGRVATELRTFFATPLAGQRRTPLEIIRRAGREPTAALRDLGLPEVTRDEFHERHWPDDAYGFIPDSAADLGDPALVEQLLRWGFVKAALVRAEISGDVGKRSGNLG